MEQPFQLDEWVLLVRGHNGVKAGTSVRVSKLYNSPRVVQITAPPAAGGATFDVPADKLAPRTRRDAIDGRLRGPGERS